MTAPTKTHSCRRPRGPGCRPTPRRNLSSSLICTLWQNYCPTGYHMEFTGITRSSLSQPLNIHRVSTIWMIPGLFPNLIIYQVCTTKIKIQIKKNKGAGAFKETREMLTHNNTSEAPELQLPLATHPPPLPLVPLHPRRQCSEATVHWRVFTKQ